MQSLQPQLLSISLDIRVVHLNGKPSIVVLSDLVAGPLCTWGVPNMRPYGVPQVVPWWGGNPVRPGLSHG